MERNQPKDGDAFPRAPTQEEWEAMSMEEREQVVESLPAEVTWAEMAMPEGDLHTEGKRQALEALRGYFKQRKRRVYLGTELPVYYPGERRFAPDLLVVLDVEPHLRGKWVVRTAGTRSRGRYAGRQRTASAPDLPPARRRGPEASPTSDPRLERGSVQGVSWGTCLVFQAGGTTLGTGQACLAD
jgi:hypothetical protein